MKLATEKILHGNKVIAEFMGEWNVKESNGRFVCTNCGHEYSAMLGDDEVPMIHTGCLPDIVYLAKYHSSWDWLMPVVDKCTQIGFRNQDFDTEIYQKWEQIFDDQGMFLGNHCDEVWDACVEFIEWYNQNK